MSTTLLPYGTMLNNRYRIINLIKSGGMSNVYLAEDTKLANRKCAVKEMCLGNFPDASQGEIKEGFEREANLLANLTHLRLPRVLDYFVLGQNQDFYYLVMDYVEGEDLGAILLSKGAFSEPQVLKIAITILEILECLHSQNPPIIYRDMKPSNIMVRCDGEVMLIDFGIARRIVTSPVIITGQTMMMQTMVGTPGFAPIEQYLGKADPRSDIYSLGITLYQLLTAEPIAPGQSLKPLKLIAPNISDPLVAIVDKATDMRADFRYQTASEMKLALQFLQQPLQNSGNASQEIFELRIPNFVPDQNIVITIKLNYHTLVEWKKEIFVGDFFDRLAKLYIEGIVIRAIYEAEEAFYEMINDTHYDYGCIKHLHSMGWAIGKMYERLGKLHEAKNWFTRVITYNPHVDKCHQELTSPKYVNI